MTLSAAATATATVALTFGKVALRPFTLTNGKTFVIEQNGIMSTASSPGTLTKAITWGGTSLGSTGSFTPTGSLSNVAWRLKFVITCIASGTSGSIWSQGTFEYQSAGAWVTVPLSNTSAVSLDTTVGAVLDIVDTWGTASSSNIIKTTNTIVSQYN